MAMPSYSVCCTRPGCGQAAVYKIAARWSDGVTGELKTYALTCPDCLAEAFARSRAKQSACRVAPGEVLDVPGIYELARGRRDAQLVRREDLEKQLSDPPASQDPST
jgi:hypothetical protein